jgi:hypothetical protein
MCLEGVGKVPERFKKVIWRVSRSCLESMQVCKYGSMQVCMYASLQVCKYASMQVCQYAIKEVCKYASVQVCKYASVQVCKCASMQVCMCASMQVCKYASVQVCKGASMQDFLWITVFATLESNLGFQQCLKSCKASACNFGHKVALLLRCDGPATQPPPNRVVLPLTE